MPYGKVPTARRKLMMQDPAYEDSFLARFPQQDLPLDFDRQTLQGGLSAVLGFGSREGGRTPGLRADQVFGTFNREPMGPGARSQQGRYRRRYRGLM